MASKIALKYQRHNIERALFLPQVTGQAMFREGSFTGIQSLSPSIWQCGQLLDSLNLLVDCLQLGRRQSKKELKARFPNLSISDIWGWVIVCLLSCTL